MTWWSKASTAQKLAQIDGGIELGLTARQVAFASKASLNSIQQYAWKHQRYFPQTGSKSPSHQRKNQTRSDRQSYLRGDRINLWGNTEAQDDFALDEVQS